MTFRLEHASVLRLQRPVLEDLSLTLSRGRVHGLLGANGAGKSTLLSVLSGELSPRRGHVTLDGMALPDRDPALLAKLRAIMPQQTESALNLTASQVIGLGLYAYGPAAEDGFGDLVERATRLAGVSAWAAEPVAVRSGGERQRIQFARVLLQALAARRVMGQAWLLLDEPTASQDPLQQQTLMACLRRLASEEGLGVAVALHDLTLAAQWCDDLVVLKQGRLIASGPSRSVLTQETLQEAFGAQLGAHVQWQPVPAVVVFERNS